MARSPRIDAVVFDLDGLLIDTEQLWDEVREALVRERGGRWTERAQADMMGMSSLEWSRYLHDELGLRDPPDVLNRLVVDGMRERYRQGVPLLPGALEAVRRVDERWPLGLASSSNRPLIDLVLDELAIADLFRATVSSEEVQRGKPAPDVYLEAARRLGVAAERCVAVEDSAAGIRSAHAAAMAVIAVPNAHFPPPEHVLSQADVVLRSLDELSADAVESASARRGR
ncbi:MAG: HAD family phosphatase [Actinomycetota bacterium]|nr:HAD family phosphatase [Actinomycetota bacterium]